MVQFADGSTAELLGSITALIVLGTPEGRRLMTTFYVLDGLTCDVLFGEEFLNETMAFTTYRPWLAVRLSRRCNDQDLVAEVSGIIWFKTSEEHILNGLETLTLPKKFDSGKLYLLVLSFNYNARVG